MSHKADCPFCKAFAVEVAGPSKELLWQLPNDSPLNKLETENKDVRKSNHTLYLRCQKLEAEDERLSNALAGAQVFAIELKTENKKLLTIKHTARLYLDHGEPELADDLDALLKGDD